MLHAREDWTKERECAEVLAFPAQLNTKGEFGRRPEKKPFSLVVDLHAEEIGLKWFRGAATLAALCSAAIFLTPDWHPEVATPAAPPAAPLKYAQLSELAAPPPQVMDDPARLRRSVIDLTRLDFDTLLVGDGTPILTEAKARLLELVQTFGP